MYLSRRQQWLAGSLFAGLMVLIGLILGPWFIPSALMLCAVAAGSLVLLGR